MKLNRKILLCCVSATIILFSLWVYRPAPSPVAPFTFPESPAEGLTIDVADKDSMTIAGTYRKGDMWVTFESTRGEPNALVYRIRDGGGPYETHGCFRNMFLQPIMTIDECVITNMPFTEDPDDEHAGESFAFIGQAINALAQADVSGLEEERDFLVQYARPQLNQ